ncbi:MAG TPA: hypothetical protein VFP08_05905 [Acidimicrobiales bacterium]|nr:hypothetical protein [Acidimicrobiales bacterium]
MTDVVETPPGSPEGHASPALVEAEANAPALIDYALDEEPSTNGDEPLDDLDAEEKRHWWQSASNRSLVQLALTVAVVGGCMVYVLANIHANFVFEDNTPTGGDFGAHVWAPAYLRDHILPHWRLSGWAPDWYGGFPLYKFYMVVPGLLTVLLDVVAPYGVALKIVSALGLVALPLCCWAFGRLANLPFPIPPLFSIAAVFFLFDWSFTIYGGNVASTMAGEFSFSIALCIAMLYLGVLARGMRTGKGRALAAVLFALAVLCHLIVGIFVTVATVLMYLLWADRKRTRYVLTMAPVAGLLTAFWSLPFLFGGAYMTDMTYERRPVGNAPNGLPDSYWQMLFPYTAWIDRSVFVLAAIGLIGCVLRGRRAGAFLGLVAVVFGAWACIWPQSHLWNARLLPFMYLARYLLAFIGVYELVALVVRHVRLELRDGAARTPSADRRRRWTRKANGLASPAAQWGVGSIVLLGVVLASLIYGGVHFQRGLPFASFGVRDGKTTYDWLFFRGTKSAFVDDWARWNYSGYEGKSAWGEYRSIMNTMNEIGAERGCGRALWEHQIGDDLTSYGTPMALMLLPFFTDGCIGSMEGLYFEAAASTPYHFLTAAAGSKQASNPVRRLAYDNNDVNRAVRYMQDLGIRYYLAFRPEAVAQADANPDLTALRQVGPWTIYEVADSEVVVPLTTNPVVVNGMDNATLPLHLGRERERWLELGTSWFQHPEDWPALPAADGPEEWQRIDARLNGPASDDRTLARLEPAGTVEEAPLEPVTVSEVNTTDNSISFSVDQVGVPVLVKASYFPNWSVDGAEGPYRVAPNFMVVVPTSNQVTLTYGTSGIEYLGYLLTLVGVVLVFVLWRKGPVRYEPVTEGPVVWQDGELRWHDEPALDLPAEPAPDEDITGDDERFEVLADQVFGPRESESSSTPPLPLPPPPPPPSHS